MLKLLERPTQTETEEDYAGPALSDDIITITCLFTREWAIDQWLKDLGNVEHDPALTNLAFVIDADEPLIKSQLTAYGREHGYRSCHIVMNSDHRPNEVRLAIRRHRIAVVKEQSKELVRRCDGEFVIGLEDDTVFSQLKSFDQLIQPFRDQPNVGFVEGVAVGRWGVPIIGGWRADDAHDPRYIETILPGEGIEEITAGGFYGYATRRHLYLNHEYYWSESQPWGPDVNYGMWLQQQGYKCLIDWSIYFGHDDHGTIGWPDTIRLSQVRFNKDPQSGKWDREDTDQ